MAYKKKYITIGIILAIVLIVDLVTKSIWGDTDKIVVIPHLFNFVSNHGNEGAAFGIFDGKKAFLIIFTFVLIGIAITVDILFKQNSKLYNIGFAFILGGGIGNLVDRLLLGYVRDFIQFGFWESFPIFNFADSFLCVGVTLIVIYLLFYCKGLKSKK